MGRPQRPRFRLTVRTRGCLVAPDEVWQRTGLRVLILADIALTRIPPALGRLRRLHTLDLGHNRLAEIPEEIGELSGLSRCLCLRGNRIRTLPDWITELSALEKLDLRWNPLDDGVDDGPVVRALAERGCVVLR